MKTLPILSLALVLAGLLPSHAKEREIVICRAELDREVLLADQRQTAVIKITLDAAPLERKTQRPRVNLCLVLDRSGSMSGGKLANAKLAAIEAVKRLDRDDVFSLVTYDSKIETLVPAGRLRHPEEVISTIRSIESRGNTALFGGVSQGASEMRKFTEDDGREYVHRMILLSDGKANVGPSSPDELGRLGASLLKEGISVSTIGVGNDYNEDLMTRIAGRSDGNSYFVETDDDLPRIFNEELGDVLSVVARKVIVTIEVPEGVRPLRTVGREANIRGREVEVRMNQLYGGQEKYILLEVEVPPTPEHQTLEVARAVCRYDNALSAQPESQNAVLLASFSAKKDVSERSANPAVQNVFYLNVSAEAKREAIELYEAGKPADAVEVLGQNSQLLRQAASQYDLQELDAEASNLEDQRERLDREGLSKKNRKELQTEYYQEKAQQRAKYRDQK